MTQDNVAKLIQPEAFSDPLTEVLREGATALQRVQRAKRPRRSRGSCGQAMGGQRTQRGTRPRPERRTEHRPSRVRDAWPEEAGKPHLKMGRHHVQRVHKKAPPW